MQTIQLLLWVLLPLPVSAQQVSSEPNPQKIFEQTKSATALILVGEGAGRLQALGSGVVISPDGVILTAFHVIKDASEVQVRLPNGEIFDRVELLGFDERRDVAALKIAARGIAALTSGFSTNLVAGDALFTVTNPTGLTWSSASGSLAAVRAADEIPGAGSGFRVLQFTAPIASGSNGAALVDKTGSLVGIITRANGSSGFAVPIESVLGLPDSGKRVTLGSGALLKMPSKEPEAAPSSAAIANTDPKKLLKAAKSIHIYSKTNFLTVESLDRALVLDKDWTKVGLVIVSDRRLADVLIEIDRPIFTYVHTYVVIDKRTSVVLTAGKVTAIDGTVASTGIAKAIVKLFSAPPTPPTPAK